MRFAVSILFWFLFITCSRSNSNNSNNPNNTPKFDEIFQVNFTLESKNYSLVLPKGTVNTGYGYIRQIAPDNFLIGKGTIFQLSNTSRFILAFGSAQGSLQSNWPEAYKSFNLLMSPGVKMYDSLQECRQLNSNRVEIMFVDESGDIWCSTKWTILTNTQIQKTVEQPGSNFIISESKEVSTGKSKLNASIIKGTFNCVLYKAGSNEKRSLSNGSFTLLVGLEG